jgi:two-component system phosphate regulon sensor histidine kinase PhoR
MPNNRKEELWLFLGITVVAITAGIVSGRLLLCLLLGLLAYLAWHIHNLINLPGILANKLPGDAYRPFGLWKRVYREIDSLHTDSRQREQGLKNLQIRFQDAVSALPEAVVILGKEGKIDWMNPAAERLLGIDYPGSSGQIFLDLVRDPILEEYLASKAFEQPLVFSPPADRAKIVSLYVTSLDRHQQQMIVASDISRQYYLDSTQRDFVANISHELRTPLTVISGLLEQIQTGNSEPPADKYSIELMQRQTIRMNELIADLLTLSHLELNEQPPVADAVNVRELLAVIAEEAHTLGNSTAHVVQLNIESPASLRGERKELHTAISNLVTNAIQHTPQRTEIRIRWRVDAQGGYLSVSDNGEGIAARHLPRLTERLYRVDASRSRSTGGTGLGLAIVKHVLERHGAELEISSTVGRGCTFTCHFPVERLIRPEAVRDAAVSY